VSPQVQAISYKLEKVAKQQADLTVLGAGRFNELQKGRLTFYAERLSADKQHMENLFIVLRDKKDSQKLPQLLTAKSAYRKVDEATGDNFLVLVDGYRYEGKPGEANYRIMTFTEYGVRIDFPGDPEVEEIQSTMPSAALVRSSDPKDVAELQWRLAMPVSVIVLLLLAVPYANPRRARAVTAAWQSLFCYSLFITTCWQPQSTGLERARVRQRLACGGCCFCGRGDCTGSRT
jgi:lipopolysaccharide export system permease protein